MDLKTFVTNTLLQIGKDLEYTDKVIKAITEWAKSKAKNGCAAIPDDEVKKFIINYDYENNKPAQEVKKQTPKPVERPNDEKHDSFVQTSLL